jgi:hypothetical protein
MARKKHSEPVRPKRPSTLVGRKTVPAVIKEREELERLLRVHDPEMAEVTRSRIKPAQLPLVRRIALDHASEGGGMVARKHAIALLGSLGAIEDLNLLSDLARFDAEPAIRAEALTGLGRSGVAMAVPTLLEAIGSSDMLEAAAASKALDILARKVGIAAVRAHLDKGSSKGKRLATAVLDKMASPAAGRSVKRSESRRDPVTLR